MFMTLCLLLKKELLDRVEKKGIYKNDATKYEMRPYQIDAKEKWNANDHNGFLLWQRVPEKL